MYIIIIIVWAQSGSDDTDNLCHLNHFFGGLSVSHPHTILFGGDPDITCSLESNVGVS